MNEFEMRCAFSDVKGSCDSDSVSLEVDHFDPSKKKDVHQDYFNLLLVSRHCNGKKGAFRPSKKDWESGRRLLNPTVEADFGQHIAECPISHRHGGFLWGKTPVGRFHIIKLALNAKFLVEQRRRRQQARTFKGKGPILLSPEFQLFEAERQKFCKALDLLDECLEPYPREFCIEEPEPDYSFWDDLLV